MDKLKACFCRRRTLFHKLLPAVIQIFVVIGVWQIFKSQIQSGTNTYGLSADRNVRSPDQPLCFPGDYSQGKNLQLSTIVSRGGSSADASPDQAGKSEIYILNVELVIRDAEHGSVIMYPAGTPVILDNNDADKRGDYIEYVEYNADDMADYNKNDAGEERKDENNAQFEGDDAGDVDYDNDNDGLQENTKDLILDYGIENMQGVDYPQISNKGQGEKQILNEMLKQDQMIPIKVENQQGQPQIFAQMNNQNQNLMQNRSSQSSQQVINNVQAGLNNGAMELNGNSQLGQKPSLKLGQQSNPAQLQAAQLYGEQPAQQQLQQTGPRGQSLTFQQRDQQQQQLLSPGDLQESQQQLNNGAAFNKPQFQVAGQKNQSVVSNQKPSGVIPPQNLGNLGFNTLVDDGTEPLYTEGFTDRVRKFKSELFGKVPDESMEAGKSPNLFHMNNPNICGGKEQIDLLYLINSIPQSNEPRQRIRDTFVDSSNFGFFTVVHVFLVGRTTSQNFQNNLNQEQQNFGDILQGEFVDTPENSTLKGLMGMRWVTQFCRQVKFVMKIDEDVLVDTDKLLRGLIPAVNKVIGNKAILCPFNPEGPISRTGPNAIPKELFPSRTNHRPYCKGFAILMTRAVISSLLAASEHVPVFPVADMYLYGILPFVAGGVEVYDVGNKRAFHDFGMEVVNCYRTEKDKCPLVASRAFSDRYTTLWTLIKTRMQSSSVNWADGQSLWNVKSFRRTL